MNVEHARAALTALLLGAALAGCGGGEDEALARQGPAEAPRPSVAAAPAAVPALPAPGGIATPAAQQPLDDNVVTMNVRRAFLADDEVKRTQLSVATRTGIVTLRGTVGSQHYIDRAVAVARTADGVADVRSEVVVSLHVPARTR